MKKVNRKGFTLIELLAVIVILAVVMVVTIPSIIESMKNAKIKSFDNAIHVIEDYVQKNYETCVLGDELGENGYDASIFTSGTCTIPNSTTGKNKLVTASGYKTTDITITTFTQPNANTNVKFKISKASANTNGKFDGVGTRTY